MNIDRNRFKLRQKLYKKTEVVRKLAGEFEALLVPLNTIFEEAEKKKETTFWSEDGIHPTMEGHKLISESWIEVITDNLI